MTVAPISLSTRRRYESKRWKGIKGLSQPRHMYKCIQPEGRIVPQCQGELTRTSGSSLIFALPKPVQICSITESSRGAHTHFSYSEESHEVVGYYPLIISSWRSLTGCEHYPLRRKCQSPVTVFSPPHHTMTSHSCTTSLWLDEGQMVGNLCQLLISNEKKIDPKRPPIETGAPRRSSQSALGTTVSSKM